MRSKKEPCAAGTWEAAIAEILEYPGARVAFERLCEAVGDSEELSRRIMLLRFYEPSRRCQLFVDRETCRHLSKKMAELCAELDNLAVAAWSRLLRTNDRPAAPVEPLTLRTTVEEADLSVYSKPSAELDLNILLEQLRVGSAHFGSLGSSRKKLPYAWTFSVFDRRCLVDYVAECMQKRHSRNRYYNELSILCEAATGGRHPVYPDSLKEDAYRAMESRTRKSRRRKR